MNRTDARKIPPTRFQRRLLQWFAGNQRRLPWRARGKQKPHPYRVWVSEIMLQQTRVAAVMDYFRRFLKQYPTVKSLVDAEETTVLAAWSGLGYYRRARMLHAAARKIVQERGGRYPQDAAGWRELPGIGRYTAAAIASICFNEPLAVVDGNVERVLRRLHGVDEDTALDVWGEAQRLVSPKRPGTFNQAMMELGATVCLPKKPLCGVCPVYGWCMTRGEHKTSSHEERRKVATNLALTRKNGKVYLVQRAKNSRLMAGMWELPQGDGSGTEIMRVKHSITTTDYSVGVRQQVGASRVNSGRWVSRSEFAKVPLTGLTRKILRKLELLG